MREISLNEEGSYFKQLIVGMWDSYYLQLLLKIQG